MMKIIIGIIVVVVCLLINYASCVVASWVDEEKENEGDSNE